MPIQPRNPSMEPTPIQPPKQESEQTNKRRGGSAAAKSQAAQKAEGVRKERHVHWADGYSGRAKYLEEKELHARAPETAEHDGSSMPEMGSGTLDSILKQQEPHGNDIAIRLQDRGRLMVELRRAIQTLELETNSKSASTLQEKLREKLDLLTHADPSKSAYGNIYRECISVLKEYRQWGA